MITVSTPTLHDRLARAPFLGLLVRLVTLIAVVVGLVVMSPTAQGSGESIGTPHVHAADDLHASGTGHGVGDSAPAAAVEPAAVAEAPADVLCSSVLGGVVLAGTGIVMLLAALGMAIARMLRRDDARSHDLRARVLPRIIPDAPWWPAPPTPVALSVFRI